MGIELLAVAGVLLLGGGLTMLIMSLRKPEGVATLDQIGTYGYVAESVGGAEEPGRRPLDSLADRLGDTAAKRLGRFSETEVRQKLVSAGMYGTTPRKILGYQVIGAIFFTLVALWGIRCSATPSCSRSSVRSPEGSSAGSSRWCTSTARCVSASRRSIARCRT